jgi:hypothetical protein
MKFWSRCFFKIKSLLLSSLIGCILPGCATTGIEMGQATITAFETRTIDSSFEQVYLAATEVLFDLGYTIQHTDKNTGIIVGEKRVPKGGSGFIQFMDALAGTYDHSESKYYSTTQIDILIQPLDERTTKVRIKTLLDKKPQLNKKVIDEVWLYIERQVLMKSGF